MSNTYEFTKLSEVEALAEVPENANALIEVEGAIKRVPGSGLGGDKGIKTAIIKSSDYDNALAGLQTAGAVAVTYSCLNMTFEEACQLVLSGEPLQAVIMMPLGGVYSKAFNLQYASWYSRGIASGRHSHSEGYQTTASGNYSHAEGRASKASGNSSHAEGQGTIANGHEQHVQGRYNLQDTDNKYAHIVGNGTEDARSNAHTIDWEGNAWFAGTVEGTAIILKSSTEGSSKHFKITVDDSGTLSVTEVTE